MPRALNRPLTLLLFVAALAVPWSVAAQEADEAEADPADGTGQAEEATPAQSAPTWPVPVRQVAPHVPEGTLEPGGARVEVILSIVVGVEGEVIDAQVKQSSGIEAIDVAAEDAAFVLEFVPSTLDGVPVEVTIDYPFVFLPPPPLVPVVVPSLLHGRVEVKGSREPVSFLDLSLFPATPKPLEEGEEPPEEPRAKHFDLAEQPFAVAETAEDGTFELAEIPPGTYVATIGSGGYKLERFLEVFEEGVDREVVYRLRPTGVPETVVVGKLREDDAPERELSGEQLKKMPGAGRDPMAAVASLPGVVHTSGSFTPSADTQAPVLRGASAEDSVLYLDGLPVPIIFHSIATFSITGDALVERAFLKPAATEARYGDLTGGVVGLDLRSPRKDRMGGFIDPGIGLFSVGLEGPITEKSRFYVGFRRSYYDILFKLIIPADAPIEFATAPYFQDQQALLEADLAPWLTLSLGYIGTLDGIKLLRTETDEDEPDPLIFSLKTDMHRIFIKGEMRGPNGIRNTLHPAITFWGTEFKFTDLFETTDRHTTFHLADDAVIPILPWLQVNAGVILEVDQLRQTRNTPQPTREDTGPQTGLATEDNLTGTQRETRVWIGGYVGVPLKPHPRVTVAPEFRFDYFSSIDQFVPQVRARVGWSPTDFLRFKLAGGRYEQAPSSEELSEISGNPELGPEGAWHINAGAQVTPGPWLDLDVQGYAKFLDHQTVSSVQASGFGGFAEFGELGAPDDEDPTHGLSNSGIGRIYGAEIFARFGFLRNGAGISGWLGYSLSWAQRKDFDDEEWRWFEHDRRHAITALLQVALPGEISIGARWQLQTGRPTTPVLDSVFYADAGAFIPTYGDLYSSRSLPYHQLDLRIDKTFRKDKHTIEIYIDVQNVYAATNGDFQIYSFDYRETAAFTGIPTINFAVRVDF